MIARALGMPAMRFNGLIGIVDHCGAGRVAAKAGRIASAAQAGKCGQAQRADDGGRGQKDGEGGFHDRDSFPEFVNLRRCN